MMIYSMLHHFASPSTIQYSYVDTYKDPSAVTRLSAKSILIKEWIMMTLYESIPVLSGCISVFKE